MSGKYLSAKLFKRENRLRPEIEVPFIGKIIFQLLSNYIYKTP